MSIKVGESGRTLRVSNKKAGSSSGFNMSSNTELTLTFVKPDGSTVTKTKTGGQVSLGAVQVTDDDLGTLNANEYVEYEVEATLFDVAGLWKVYLTYTDTVPDPDDKFIGTAADIEVLPATG